MKPGALGSGQLPGRPRCLAVFPGAPQPTGPTQALFRGMESRDPLAFGQFMLVIFSCLPKTFTTLEENCTADLGLYFLNFFFFFLSQELIM